MFDEYHHHVNNVSEAHWYDAVRTVMPPAFRHLEDDRLDRVLSKTLKQLPLEEQEVIIESLGKIARSFGRTLARNAGTIGQVGGAAIGTFIGGPGVGTAAGAAIGGAVGRAVQGSTGQHRPQRPLPSRRPAPPSRGYTPSRGYAPAVPSTPSLPARSGPVSQHPAGRNLMLSNHMDFLIQIVRAVLESVINALLQRQGRLLPAGNSRPSEGMIPLSEFSNAFMVFGEEGARHSPASSETWQETSGVSPKEQAETLYRVLFASA